MQSKVHPRYKTKYRVANWAAYNQALVRRGDVTVWVSSEAITAWTPRRSGRRGGQRRYSDLAIETALTLRLLYHLPLPRLLAHQGALVGAGGLTGKRHRRPGPAPGHAWRGPGSAAARASARTHSRNARTSGRCLDERIDGLVDRDRRGLVPIHATTPSGVVADWTVLASSA